MFNKIICKVNKCKFNNQNNFCSNPLITVLENGGCSELFQKQSELIDSSFKIINNQEQSNS